MENLTLRASEDGLKVTDNGASAIGDQLTVAGDKSFTYKGIVDKEKIVNELTAGTLTVQADDAGAIDVSKIDADVIELMGVHTGTTVADNQNILLKTATFNSAIVAADGVTNATVNIKNQHTAAAITKIDVSDSDIATLNLEADEITTVSVLQLAAQNNVNITGDSKTTITAMTGTTGAVSIDASKLTGEFVVTSTTVNVATGIVGSSTAKNTITTGATTANVTVITGSADDTITGGNTTAGTLTINAGDGKNTVDAKALTTGTAKITTGSGNDTIDLSKLTTTGKATVTSGAGDDTIDLSALAGGKATITAGAGDDKVTVDAAFTAATEFKYDGGTGTDTLVVGTAAIDLKDAKIFELTSVENLTIFNGSTLAGWQLDGKSYEIKSDGNNKTLKISIENPNNAAAITTDLSKLAFSTSTTSNFSSVEITGKDNVADTIYGTKMNDTIDAGSGAKDVINISAGGNNIILINAGDSTYTSTVDRMDAITGFHAVTKANGADLLKFTTAGAIGNGAADTDVKGAITNGTGLESVVANISTSGILSISGKDAGAIDTLAEWMVVAETVLEDGSLVAGATTAFQFSGNTYVYHVSAAATNAVTTAEIIQLVGVTGVAGLALDGNADFAEGAANTILIG
ncbi:beta strand repeat-containing protein [Aliarcobacter cryaerophilus]|uniref:beta strand repeat-containing protein n=1 Tax=Aliarcobacter cryaerophilus TaxID=28198 RepID=UPI0013FD1565|nr:DUF4097 domain-containing protein [Aliarcobacter cryaerophilus]